jgi:hypothetical protein
MTSRSQQTIKWQGKQNHRKHKIPKMRMEMCGIKQAPETREDGVGERDKECGHESHEDWREQRFVAKIVETNK